MSTFKLFKQKFKDGEREIIRVNYKPEKLRSELKVKQMHHIHIIDRSGSMWRDIDGLIEDIKKTIEVIPLNDFISVIWFSGENQVGSILKFAQKTVDYKYMYKILDSIKSTLATTYFTQTFDEIKEIMSYSKEVCPNYNVTLFTDGESCCKDSRKDMEDSLRLVKEISEDIISFNTIGYGNYYNRDFLEELAISSEFGIFNHSSNIKDYSKIFSHNYERINDLIMDKVNIETDCEDCEILYLSNKNTKLVKKDLHMNKLNKLKNQFFIILPKGVSVDDVCIKFNNEILSLNKEQKENRLTTNNMLYALAYEYYYQNNREASIDVLSIVRDKVLIDSHLNAFSNDEVAKHTKLLRNNLFKVGLRNLESCKEDYLPDDEQFCVMELLQLLATRNCLYLPDSKKYKRIGLKVEDKFNLFKPSKEQPIARFKDMVFNKDKLNVSIRFTKKGVVSINPKQAKENDLPTEIYSKIYQNHTIIKDGNLNIKTLKVALNDIVAEELKDYNLITKEYDEEIEELKIYDIDLTKIPIINRKIADKSSDISLITGLVRKNFELEVKQKVLNYLIKKNYNIDDYISNYDNNFTAEQFKLLQEHGLDKNLNYVGVAREVTEKNENDFYMARSLNFSLKGCSSIPSVESALKKYEENMEKGKTSNLATNLIYYYYNNLVKGEKDLEVILTDVKTELTFNRITLDTMKIAKVLTGSWWSDLQINEKGQYTYTQGDNTLIIKSNYTKEYFN